jgi:P-type Ca2+ transporter type 2C
MYPGESIHGNLNGGFERTATVCMGLYRHGTSMIQAIHTAVPGRARYKVEGLYRSASLKRHLEARLTAVDSIQEVSASTLTGNILLRFDPAQNAAEIIALLDGVVAEHTKKAANGVGGSRRINPNGPGGHIDSSRTQTTAVPAPRDALSRPVTEADEQRDVPWHHMDADAVAALFETSTVHGLSQPRVEANYRKYGPNLLPEAVPRSGLSIFLDQFKSGGPLRGSRRLCARHRRGG